jgi:proton-dependent oligopeptide transporter, POT family
MTTSLRQLFRQFPRTFWAAIITELLHCLASYTMNAYLIVYLSEDLGFGQIRANTLFGTMLFMGYFLPILIGALADRYGFKQTMVASLTVITAGYFVASRVTSYPWMFAALMLIALGGAAMKPVIAGTVKAATTDETRTLGFSIYYMMINVGSFIAPFLANQVRLRTGEPSMIFVACGVVEASVFLVALTMFQNLPVDASARSKNLATVLNEMVVVLCNLRLFFTGLGLAALWLGASRGFIPSWHYAISLACSWVLINLSLDVFFRSRDRRQGPTPRPQLLQPQRFGDLKLLIFILIFSCVWALYSQIWTNIPLFILALDPGMKRYIEYFQAVDPIMIVLFQVAIGKWMGKYRPVPSMMWGILISAGAVGSIGILGHALGAWAVGISLALWAVGEMMFSPRSTEYVSVIAPPDKLALYIGYGFLPLAIGMGFGPPVGARLVQAFKIAGRPDWVWFGFALWAALIAVALAVYDRWVRRGEAVRREA